jgi:hypothetical protein
MAWLAIRAPAGYEDERGFHLGKPPEAPSPRKDEDEAG